MKKQELTQLTQVIEHLVAREVRKQLPTIIAETFQNMMGKSLVTASPSQTQPIQEQVTPSQSDEQPSNFKASLRELFAGTSVIPEVSREPRKPIQYAKNPVLNQILNETTSDLRDRERLVGAAAFAGGYSPSLDFVPGFNPKSVPVHEDASFTNNMPSPAPRSRPQVFQEGVISPVAIPPGTSPAVVGALTKNYSQMMKLIDKKRGKI